MTTLSWDNVGERLFETGLDRGVLYVGSDPGVPWNGLVALNEAPSGGELKEYYIDGVKYLNAASPSEFQGTLNAFSCPLEFAQCEGVVTYGGLSLMDQPKKMFGLSYRTLIGNDIESTDHGYKIHLIYNALAGTPTKDYATMGDAVTPLTLSWPITARPIIITGVRPSAHLIISSIDTDAADLLALEDILYGTEDDDPRMPTAEELATIFGTPPPPAEPPFDDIIDGGSPAGMFESIDGGGP